MQRALFDNPVGEFSTEEIIAVIRELGHTGGEPPSVAELADGVLDKLAIKRTRRAREVVMDAIRLARRAEATPHDIAPTALQAGGAEVRAWARAARYDVDEHEPIPAAVIAAYNRAHPDRPY